MVTYRDFDNSDFGTAVIGDVSGNTITYGSEYVFDPGATWESPVAALSPTESVVAYTDTHDPWYGAAVIGGRLRGNVIGTAGGGQQQPEKRCR